MKKPALMHAGFYLLSSLSPQIAGYCIVHRAKENAQLIKNQLGVSRCKSLTMSYFHTGIRTIIGAKAFHCPVRDGKEWYHLAMVIRHNCLTGCLDDNQSDS
jgi:hypothetical protein